MTALQFTAVVVLSVYGVIALFFAVTDQVVRRQHQSSLEMRDWQEKVEAMRRIYDEEGEA
jgi:hypothetical protein